MADKSLSEAALEELIKTGHGSGDACQAFLKSLAPPAPEAAPAAEPAKPAPQ